MGTEHLWRRTRLVLTYALIWLALLNALVWTGPQWVTWHTTHFDLPIAPGRAVHVHVGDPFSSGTSRAYPYTASSAQAYAPMRISIRYRVGPGWQGRQLFSAFVPTWPLLAMLPGTTLALLLVTLLPRYVTPEATLELVPMRRWRLRERTHHVLHPRHSG